MNLFTLGYTVLHSGFTTDFKIDCDALNVQEVQALCHVIAKVASPFGEVVGVPTGGIRIADELRLRCQPEVERLLIVDDVLTTGASMEETKAQLHDLWDDIVGVVLFARGPCPEWVTPLFELNRTVQETINYAGSYPAGDSSDSP